ncbi:MAG: hypothetical protein WA140_11135 [Geobacteraceae bacterium]
MTSLLIVALAAPVLCAPPIPRPYTGVAALVVPMPLSQSVANHTIVLYQEPGVGRIGEFPLARLPRFALADVTLLVVMGRKGKWLKIAYDEAGREGWLEPTRRWECQPWEQFLRGRLVRLLPGIRKEYHALRNDPSGSAAQLDPSIRQNDLRVIEVKGEWVMVMAGTAFYGWLRWRDADGRFLISIDTGFTPQNH